MTLLQVAQPATDLARAVACFTGLPGAEPVATFDPPGLAFSEGNTVGLVSQLPISD